MAQHVNHSLINGSILQLMYKMSIPAMVGIVSYHLYNVIDTIYISRGINVDAAGGLAITLPLFIFLSAISTTMGTGSASCLSRALGNKDLERANIIAANIFIVFCFFSITITIIGLVYLEQILSMMGVTEVIKPYAEKYSRIILMGAITSTGFLSLMRAEGASRYAMYQWVIPVMANLLLDPIFIFFLT